MFVTVLLTALLVDGAPIVPERSQQPYRFILDAERSRPVEFRGLITVDGESRAIDPTRTPFEFGCEAGSVITGYFEAIGEDGKLRLRVFDPGYSHRRAAAVVRRARLIRFSWAQPGVAPRCLDVDAGHGACPDTVPGVNEMKLLLNEMHERLDGGSSPAVYP